MSMYMPLYINEMDAYIDTTGGCREKKTCGTMKFMHSLNLPMH